jgi:hypothetical protein
LPPPSLYNIVEREWPQLKPDAAEDAEYVGDVAMFVNEVPTEVTEPALRLWLLTALAQHTEGLHEALMRLKETEEELNLLEATIERLASGGAGGAVDEEDEERRKAHALRLEVTYYDALKKLLERQAQVKMLEAGGPQHVKHLFMLTFIERHAVTSQNKWSVVFAPSQAGQSWAYIACHLMDLSLVRLALNVETGKA